MRTWERGSSRASSKHATKKAGKTSRSRSSVTTRRCKCLVLFCACRSGVLRRGGPSLRYRAGMKELSILKKLAETVPDNKKHVIRLHRQFEHKGHLCLVFESLRYLSVFLVGRALSVSRSGSHRTHV